MSGRRCGAAGCGRFVRAGETRCRAHRDAGRAVGIDDEDEAGASEDFRRRLAEGDYRALFGPGLNEIIAQAAAERGLTDEIGALRVVLARLLAEEKDLAKLAASASRVVGVAVQAARAQRAISGELADGLTDALTQILSELDGEGRPP